jgi:protein TIF31
MIKELQADDTGRLGDSASLSEIFHFFGINNRYLGNVCKRIDDKTYPNLKIILEKAIFVRSLKHVLRE